MTFRIGLRRTRERLNPWHHPALEAHEQQRLQRFSNRLADGITGFAGSMRFVAFHVVWFTVWITVGIEHYPFGLLTMIVSLEAIFLTAFVMISQNRADERRRILAEYDARMLAENTELTKLVKKQTDLLQEIHRHITALTPGAGEFPPDQPEHE